MIRKKEDGLLGRVGYGTITLGIKYPVATRRPTAEVAIQLVQDAISSGVTLIDTADTYCGDGHDLHYVEKLISRAILTHPNQDLAREVVVATKTGMIRIGESSSSWRPGDCSPAGVRRAVEASRAALGVETIDLWQLHHTSDVKDLEAVLEEVVAMVREKKIRSVGLCNATAVNIELALATTGLPLVSIQNHFSPWERAAEEPLPPNPAKTCKKGILRLCQTHGLAFLPHGALGGVKARDGRVSVRRDFPNLSPIAQSKGLSPEALVLAWMRSKWPCIVHIASALSIERIKENITASQTKLSAEEIIAVERAFHKKK